MFDLKKQGPGGGLCMKVDGLFLKRRETQVKTRQWVRRREKGLRMRNTRRNLSFKFLYERSCKINVCFYRCSCL